mmetsp:Transcript_3582/g.13102  ORF Transcript_3582/g.13102 Transcript_3582/m.13102 type:complete len:412 (-) Transcript_3582:166-1401(-)
MDGVISIGRPVPLSSRFRQTGAAHFSEAGDELPVGADWSSMKSGSRPASARQSRGFQQASGSSSQPHTPLQLGHLGKFQSIPDTTTAEANAIVQFALEAQKVARPHSANPLYRRKHQAVGSSSAASNSQVHQVNARIDELQRELEELKQATSSLAPSSSGHSAPRHQPHSAAPGGAGPKARPQSANLYSARKGQMSQWSGSTVASSVPSGTTASASESGGSSSVTWSTGISTLCEYVPVEPLKAKHEGMEQKPGLLGPGAHREPPSRSPIASTHRYHGSAAGETSHITSSSSGASYSVAGSSAGQTPTNGSGAGGRGGRGGRSSRRSSSSGGSGTASARGPRRDKSAPYNHYEEATPHKFGRRDPAKFGDIASYPERKDWQLEGGTWVDRKSKGESTRYQTWGNQWALAYT